VAHVGRPVDRWSWNVFVIYLMASNMAAAAGAASSTLFFKAIPWIVALLLFGSLASGRDLAKVKPGTVCPHRQHRLR